MNKNTLRTLLIFGSITLVSILAIQIYSLVKAWELKDEQFDQKVRVALHNVAERIADYNDGTLPPKEIISRRSPNYYVVNINDVINAITLEYFLHDEFSDASLNLDFEYAVFDCFADKMIYGNYCKVGQEHEVYNISRELPTYDEFIYYFGIRFPTRASFILTGLTRYWIGALVLLFTIGFFFYLTYVILSQKKITEMQRDFINNMTHEFKTPLSSIKISSDVLAKSPMVQSDERLSQYVDIIKEQGARLNNQIERVLKIATVDRDSLNLNKEMLDLNEIVKDVGRSRLAEVESVGGNLSADCTAGIEVYADQVHLSNILHNLLDNAIKYSGGNIDIALRTAYEKETPVFEIQDKGIGMSEDQLEKIGQKFFRVSNGDIHDVKGFGLGLYYVKQICRQHGWTFYINSVLGKGTIIKIFFNN